MTERLLQLLPLIRLGRPRPSVDMTRRQLLKRFPMWVGFSAATVWPELGAGQESAVLKVGFLSNYTPFSFSGKDGSLRGFDVDVVTRLAALMGVKVVPVVDTMANLQRLLRAGELQLIGNQLLTTPENRREHDFIKPYASIQLVCVQHEGDSRDFLGLDDLFGHKLGVLAKTGMEEQARNVLGKGVVAFEKVEDGLRLLAEKKLDAVLEESLIVDYYIERDNLPIKTTAPFAAPMQVGLAVKKGDRVMQERLNAGVAILMKDSEFKKISETWFGYDVSRARVGHVLSL